MPLYHFDILDGKPPIVTEGVELASMDAARLTALRYAGALIGEQAASFWNGDEWVMTVSDAHRLTLFTIIVTTSDAPAIGRALAR